MFTLGSAVLRRGAGIDPLTKFASDPSDRTRSASCEVMELIDTPASGHNYDDRFI
jgi:hypothetical protein